MKNDRVQCRICGVWSEWGSVHLCKSGAGETPRAQWRVKVDPEDSSSALDHQEGGAHYKNMAIQPVEFIQRNGIPWCEANAIKYLCRWRHKNGIEDLKKARHYIDLLIEMESKP